MTNRTRMYGPFLFLKVLELLIKPQKRSSCITILAWTFIILAGFATFISILNIVNMMMFALPIEQALDVSPQVKEQSSNFLHFLFNFFLVSATIFAISIGLLRRKNWARIIFITIMCVGIGCNIFILAYFMQNPEIIKGSFILIVLFGISYESATGIMAIVLKYFFIMPVGISVIFVWIIYKLSSAKIKGEFTDILLNEETAEWAEVNK